MVFDRGLPAMLSAAGLVACGVAAALAWRTGLWGLFTGALLTAGWLAALNWWMVARPRATIRRARRNPNPDADAEAHSLLLDIAPTPMLAVEGETVRALNRAARRLFATDDRVLPPPPALANPRTSHVRHDGRNWRVDRVVLAAERGVVALVDVEQEARTAEARATAELIQVLGHELMNGLAPIASLAESGLLAVDRADTDPALLRDILGTLARRAEGLQRFAEAYRALARLPDPTPRPVAVGEVTTDLARLFAGRWPGVALTIDADGLRPWPMDRDQIAQALWALLQNAAEAAAPRPAPIVGLSARVVDNALAIEVTDNGEGIDPAAAAHIFRPFHTTKAGGTGIGLSLARQIVHAHGGTLTLASHDPTTFRLTLPALAAADRLIMSVLERPITTGSA